MTDHPANAQFQASSVMQGQNAEYREQMYARYADDPSAVADSPPSLGEAVQEVIAKC